MKTNFLRYLLILFGIIIIYILIISTIKRSAIVNLNLTDGSRTNNTGNSSAEFIRASDPQTGQYAIVNLDKKIVTLKDKKDNIIWKTNVLNAVSERRFPMLDDKKIWSMEFLSNQFYVRIGKELITIDQFTGKVRDIGSD